MTAAALAAVSVCAVNNAHRQTPCSLDHPGTHGSQSACHGVLQVLPSCADVVFVYATLCYCIPVQAHPKHFKVGMLSNSHTKWVNSYPNWANAQINVPPIHLLVLRTRHILGQCICKIIKVWEMLLVFSPPQPHNPLPPPPPPGDQSLILLGLQVAASPCRGAPA